MAMQRAELYAGVATAVNAGLGVAHALRSVTTDQSGRDVELFRRVADHLEGGATVGQAVEAEGPCFSVFERAVLAAGERGGRLDEVLGLLGDWFLFRRRLQRILVSGLAYPAFVIVLAAFVLPIPLLFFGGGGLPEYLLSATAILGSVAVPACLLAALWRLPDADHPVAQARDRICGHIPLLGTALANLALSRYARAFQILYEAGVPLGECAEVSQAACANAWVASGLSGAAQSLERGEPASHGFTRPVPADYRSIWRNGEETGTLDRALGQLADSRAEAGQHALHELITWLPRLIYLAMVLLIAYALIRIVGGYTDTLRELMP